MLALTIERLLSQVRDKISDYETLIREMQLETQQIESQAEKLEAQWKDDVERIYSPFQLEMDLYQHSLEQSIQERKERASKRFEELRQLEHRAQVLNEREGNLRRECRTLESEIERFQIAEKAGDEEVSSLATQIQEALAKVSIFY